MILALAAAALAAPVSLAVRQECDAAGGLPSAADPLVLTLARASDPKATTKVTLGALGGTRATTSFAVLLTGGVADTRVLEIAAWTRDGKLAGSALADVDVVTGTVLAIEGEGISLGRIRTEEVRAGGDEPGTDFRVAVELHDEVATAAAMVTLTDLTGDGALLAGDVFDQALALGALTADGRGLVGRWTFDDAHPVDSSRQTWEGTATVDTAWDGAEVVFTGSAARCLPDGVAAPADGTLAWTETLVVQGSAKKPKWKSVTLGLREPETETWAWPFSARVADAGAEGVYVRLVPLDGAVKPRSTDAWVKVPARERLSGAVAVKGGDGVEVDISVQAAGAKPGGPQITVVRVDNRVRFRDSGGAALPAPEVVVAWSDKGWAPSALAVRGPEEADWDGAIEVSVRGPAVWDDLDATVTVRDAATGAVTASTTFPLTDLVSVFEGAFVFDASFDGGWYRWECAGCGDGFSPFEIQANLGTGTRTSSSQASTKAELL